jgi:hypothetical protein
LQIVGPHFAGSGDEDAEKELPAIGGEGHLDGVLLPPGGSLDLEALDGVEGEVAAAFAVNAQPHADVVGDIFRTQVTAEFDSGVGEVERDGFEDSAKGGIPGPSFDARRPFAAVDDLVVERDGAVAAVPSGGGSTGVIGFEIENALERAALRAAGTAKARAGSNRRMDRS